MASYLFLLLLPAAFAGWFYPEQIRLSWTENEGEMRVMWVTYWDISSIVWLKPFNCDQTASTMVRGDTHKIDVGDISERSEYVHVVTLSNISSLCEYQYQVGNGWVWSQVHQFRGRTPDYLPPFEDAAIPSSVIIFGDWGTGPWGWHTLHLLEKQAQTQPYDAILHIGDIAYNLYTLEGLFGDMFLRMVEPVASQVPYMVGPGNHEDYHNFQQYVDRFSMPVTSANGGSNMFYSLNIGPVHYIMLTTEYFFTSEIPSSLEAQMAWLESDLEEANSQRDIRPWIVLGTHHPIYCSVDWKKPMIKPGTLGDNGDCGPAASGLRPHLEDIYYNSKIDLVVQGHVHNYERDSPIYQNETVPSAYDDLHTHIDPNAPIYIISGNAGNIQGHNDPVSTTPQPWALWTSNDYGFGRVTANQSHLLWEQYSSQSGERIDYVWVVKT